MCKLMCPIDGCHQMDFSIAFPTQQHVTEHLRAVHGINITAANREDWRRLQNEAWEREYQRLEGERSAIGDRDHRAWAAFVRNPSLGLPESSATDAFRSQYYALVNVDDDDEELLPLGYGTDPNATTNGSGIVVSASGHASVRIHPWGHDQRGWWRIRDPFGAAAKRGADWFVHGDKGKVYTESLRSTQLPANKAAPMVFPTDDQKRHYLKESGLVGLRESQRKMGDALKAFLAHEENAEAAMRQNACSGPVNSEGEREGGVPGVVRGFTAMDLDPVEDEGVQVIGT